MSHKNQYATALAGKIVKDQFGVIPQKVITFLLCKGLQSLPEVLRGTELSASLVRQALLILVQHNYVAVYQQKDDEGLRGSKPPQHLYLAIPDQILQNIRKSRCLLHIKEEMGDIAEHIVEVLFENGRLRLDQVLTSVAAKSKDPDTDIQDKVRNLFMSLVQSHYLERVPSCTLPPPQIQPHPNSVKTRRAAKPGSEAFAEQQMNALKHMDEAQYEKERFRLPSEVILAAVAAETGTAADGTGADGSQPPPAKKARMKVGQAKAVPGSKPKADGTPATAPTPPPAPTSGIVLWRVNCEEFNRRFRHQVVISMVAEKLDADAGTVVAAMMTASRAFETKLQQDRSVQLSEEEVASTAAKLIDTGVLPNIMTDVFSIVRTIAADSLEMVSYLGEGPGGALYCVNMQRIIDLVRMKQLEAVVRDRFGPFGLRIFRLLMIRGQLEQKQVADFSMMPQKEARELMYRMLAAGFLTLQEIPRTADRAPSRSFYTWGVDVRGAGTRLASELYRAAFNVLTRLEHEKEQEREILDLVREAREIGEMRFTLTNAQRQHIARLTKVSDAMEASLLHLDDMIAIFNDF